MAQDGNSNKGLKSYLNEQLSSNLAVTTLNSPSGTFPEKVTFNPSGFRNSPKRGSSLSPDDLQQNDKEVIPQEKRQESTDIKISINPAIMKNTFLLDNNYRSSAATEKTSDSQVNNGPRLKQVASVDNLKANSTSSYRPPPSRMRRLKERDNSLEDANKNTNRVFLEVDTQAGAFDDLKKTSVKPDTSHDSLLRNTLFSQLRNKTPRKTAALYTPSLPQFISPKYGNIHSAGLTPSDSLPGHKQPDSAQKRREKLINPFSPASSLRTKRRPESQAYQVRSPSEPKQTSETEPAQKKPVPRHALKIIRPPIHIEDVAQPESAGKKFVLTKTHEASSQLASPKTPGDSIQGTPAIRFGQQLKELETALKSIQTVVKPMTPGRVAPTSRRGRDKKFNMSMGGNQQPMQSQDEGDTMEKTEKRAMKEISLMSHSKERILAGVSGIQSDGKEDKEFMSSTEKFFTKPQRPRPKFSEGNRNSAHIKQKESSLAKFVTNYEAPSERLEKPGEGGIRRQHVKNAKSLDGNNHINQETIETVKLDECASPADKVVCHNYYMKKMRAHWRKYDTMSYFCRLYRDHFYQMFHEIKLSRSLRPTDGFTLSKKSVNLAQRASHKGKKTLIFDLDETLVHCNPSADMPCDVHLPVILPEGVKIMAGLNIRPYAVECLQELSKYYEIMVFTASQSCYANVVIDYLDPHREYIHHRLFRESCIQFGEGINVKDLRIIKGRNLSDMVLIDNAANSFALQLDNGVPMLPYYNNKEDRELLDLIDYLKSIQGEPDLRVANRRNFRFEEYGKFDTPRECLENVVFKTLKDCL